MYLLIYKNIASVSIEKSFDSFTELNSFITDNKISNFKFKKLNK